MTALQVNPSYLHDGETACIAVSPSDLRQLFGQVEAEFQHSKVYRKILSWFQHQLQDNEELVPQLANALGKEAIRLTLRQLVASSSQISPEESTPHPTAFTAVASSPQEPAASACGSVDDRPIAAVDSASAPKSNDAVSYNPFEFTPEDEAENSDAVHVSDRVQTSDRVPASQATPAPVAPATAAKQTQLQQIELESASNLAELGGVLKQVREQRGLTLEQLHRMTHVPKHHIQAIESGAVDQLPEEVYVRGFVRHLCGALGLENPQSTPYASPAPTSNTPTSSSAPASGTLASGVSANSWRCPPAPQFSRAYLRPAHLYTGYATLMLGALGSLCWVTWQPIADEIDWPELTQVNEASLTETHSKSRSGDFGKRIASKLRYFELSKQRSRHLIELDSIAAPELILEQLQATPISEVP